MTTLLVANRGEIVLRIFRTARRMGMRCVAVYSDADVRSMHVRAADDAVRIGEAPARDSYLRIDRIVGAAVTAGASLVHPGYGFLAEEVALAEACEKAGIGFVGPPPAVLRAMGDKAHARRLAQAAGVPVFAGWAPGAADADAGDAAVLRAAETIGYPVVVKPVAGGGGKGMSIVENERELRGAVEAARRLADAAFGDDRILLERCVPGARHVEVQLLADAHGSVIHLFERDCTVQRRHQKVIEEAPSPAVSPALRERLCDAAVRLARAAGYVGAGTCEFLLAPDDSFGFIEVNARLQVEHPVTEAVTGVDLVEWQLRIASGGTLPSDLVHARPLGHAIEARVYAEDPATGFLPQSGRLLHVAWPPGARVDAGVESGSDVTPHYDPLLAKVIVRADDRPAAVTALREALGETVLLGLRTNVSLLSAAAAHPAFASGDVTTTWLERLSVPDAGPVPDEAVASAARAEARRLLHATGRRDPWARLATWRVGGPAPVVVVLRPGDDETVIAVDAVAALTEDGVAAARGDDAWFVWLAGRQWEIPVGAGPRRPEESGSARLEAPMPGTVIAVRVAAGDRVTRGQELVVVEAMKMEHPVVAPADGVVHAVLCAPAQRVDRGQTLVEFVAGGVE